MTELSFDTAVQAPLLLSSRPEIESIFSSNGVNLRIDDDDDGVTTGVGDTNNDEGYLIDALVEGSDETYMRLLSRYLAVDLETSSWVRRRTSYIVCHLLSMRKGNPAQYCDMYERYLKAFEEIKSGKYFIPFLKPRGNFAPTMSNLAVDHWFPSQKLRTMVAISEGPTDPKQFADNVNFGYRGFWF